MSDWAVLRNWLAETAPPGSIHHDETARAAGFPAGLVPGDVHLVLTSGAMVEHFGAHWYERGHYRHTFVAATYDGEEARIEIEELEPLEGDEGRVEFRLVRRHDGALVGAGSGGLAAAGRPVRTPWQRPDALPARERDGYDPLPHEPVDTSYEPWEHAVDDDAFLRSIEGNDASPWYRSTSPWSEPIVPTVGPFNLAHRIRPTPIPATIGPEIRAGVNARFECLHTGPMLVGHRYLRRPRLVDKGALGRYAFRTVEFTYEEPASGEVVFAARWHIKWVTSRPA